MRPDSGKFRPSISQCPSGQATAAVDPDSKKEYTSIIIVVLKYLHYPIVTLTSMVMILLLSVMIEMAEMAAVLELLLSPMAYTYFFHCNIVSFSFQCTK